MTQGREWLYYLLKSDGSSWRKENGLVVAKSDYKPLYNTPDGWQDILIAWKRSLTEHSFGRNFSLPFGFENEGADILRYLFYTFNIEQITRLLIQEERLFIDPTFYYFWYKYFYRGELDWSTFEDMEDRVSIAIAEGGLSKLYEANKATVYEIPFDSDCVNVKMDGVVIQNNAQYLVLNGALDSNFGQHTIDGTIISDESLGARGAISPNRIHFANNQDLFENGTPFLVTNNYISDVKIRAKFGFQVSLSDGITPNPNAGGRILVRVLNNLGVATGFYILKDYAGSANMYQHQTVQFPTAPDEWITMAGVPANSRLYLANFLTLPNPIGGAIEIASGSGADEVVAWNYDNNEADTIEVSYPYRQATTYVKAFKRMDLFRKLVAKITGNADDAKSDLLTATPSPLITSGDAIRGLETAVIKTSLENFRRDCNVQFMCGIGVENGKIALEVREHYYDPTPTNTRVLGGIKNWVHRESKDFVCNTIKVGYPDIDANDVNGKYAFNTTATWTTPVKRIVQELDLTTLYKADPFELEIKRANLNGQDTTDDQNDNDVCILDAVASSNQTINTNAGFLVAGNLIILNNTVKIFKGQIIKIDGSLNGNNGTYQVLQVAFILIGQVVAINGPLAADEDSTPITITFLTGLIYNLVRNSYDSVEGIPDVSSIFNLEISPKRLLMKHYRWIRSMMYGFDGEKIVYASGQRNHTLKTTKGSVVVDEDADVTIWVTVMGAYMFKPVEFEFEPEYPGDDLVDELESTPNKSFGFVHPINGLSFGGFGLDIGIAPNSKKEQKLKLLSSPLNDLTVFGK